MTAATVSGILSELEDIVSDQLQARRGRAAALAGAGSSEALLSIPIGRASFDLAAGSRRGAGAARAPPAAAAASFSPRAAFPAVFLLLPQVVTYKWLGRRFNVPYDTAKRILFQFLTKHGRVRKGRGGQQAGRSATHRCCRSPCSFL